MVIRELIHKVTGRLKKITGGEPELEELEKEPKLDLDLETEEFDEPGPPPEPIPEPEPEPEPKEEPEPSDVDMESIKNSLENIKGKLELLETHLETLESKDEYHRAEADRFIQYLTFINEKLDHLEREHAEIERLVQQRKAT